MPVKYVERELTAVEDEGVEASDVEAVAEFPFGAGPHLFQCG